MRSRASKATTTSITDELYSSLAAAVGAGAVVTAAPTPLGRGLVPAADVAAGQVLIAGARHTFGEDALRDILAPRSCIP